MKVFLVLLLVGFLTGCSEERKVEKTGFQVIDRAGGNYRERLSSCEFEGHKYVLYSSDTGCGIVHHPDCKCKERKAK